MKNFDFESKKNLIIIALVCLLFAIFIMKAFEFIPKDEVNEPTNDHINIEQMNKVSNSENLNSEEESDVDTDFEQDTEEDIEEESELLSDEESSDNAEPVAKNNSTLEPLETISEVGKESISYISVQFSDAENAVNQKSYAKAIKIYNSIISSNSTIEEKAKSYEGLASVYAKEGEFGNALSYAQKSYELSPSSSRELLLARIYEKLEESELAKQHMENVLKKDFE